MVMIRQGRRRARNFPRVPSSRVGGGGGQMQISKGIKSLSTGGGDCGSQGPQKYNLPWAPIFH